jgi:hypothetical protein
VVAIALQMLLAAVAAAAPGASSVEAVFGASCATAKDADQTPASPLSSHHEHGACCFLHAGGVAEPPRLADASALLSPPSAHDFAFGRVDSAARASAPELGSLSPRAPPGL